jgi:hypothetical protein
LEEFSAFIFRVEKCDKDKKNGIDVRSGNVIACLNQ